MAVIKAVNSKASIGKIINYITKGEKTEEKLILGKDCTPATAIDEMKATKEQWKKTEGRQYKHYVQSFNPKDKITSEKANEIGKKFIENTEKFKGHEVLMATHVDKGHIHNHFIVNSVNFENGKKYQEKKQDLEILKEKSNELSRDHGLSIPTKGENITSFNQKKYKSIEKGATGKEKSYLLDTAKEVSSSLSTAISQDAFIKNMEHKGYQVNYWDDKRKYITVTTPKGQKVRSTNLEKTFKQHKFSKEGMENEFQRNRETTRTTSRSIGGKERPSRDTRNLLINRGSFKFDSSRASNTDKSNQQESGREQDGQTGFSQETRKEPIGTKQTAIERERDIQGHETRNDRPQINKPTRDTKDFSSYAGGNTQERGETQRDDKTDKGHGILSKRDTQPIMEGKGETIRSTVIDNNKPTINISGGIPSGEPFGEILKSLSNAIDKVNNIEKAKTEEQEKEKFKPKTREKSKSWDIER